MTSFTRVGIDPFQGREQANPRPALILSIDAFNASSAELVTVLPMTSKPRPNNPFRVAVLPPEGGVNVPSFIISEQVRTISTARLIQRLGRVKDVTLARAANHVRMLLGLI
jgi:mRNA interferase MazF